MAVCFLEIVRSWYKYQSICWRFVLQCIW